MLYNTFYIYNNIKHSLITLKTSHNKKIWLLTVILECISSRAMGTYHKPLSQVKHDILFYAAPQYPSAPPHMSLLPIIILAQQLWWSVHTSMTVWAFMATSSPGQWLGSIVPPYMQIPICNEVHCEYVSGLYMCVHVCVYTCGCMHIILLLFLTLHYNISKFRTTLA